MTYKIPKTGLAQDVQDKLDTVPLSLNQDLAVLDEKIDNTAAGVSALNSRVDTEVDTLNARITSEAADIDGNLTELASSKYDKAGGHIGGDVSISGKLTVHGGMAEVEAGHVRTSDTVIRVNDGETGAGVTAGFAGMEVDRGTEEDYEFGFNESTKLFEVGKAGNRQPLLTRVLAPVANKFFRWNAGTKQAETVDITWDDVTGKLSNVSKTEAEAGTSTTARFWSSLRVREAILGWWSSSASKTKLDGIETGAQVNVATNLSYTASSRVLASSTGTDATLPQVSTANDGLMIAADKTKLNNIAANANNYTHPTGDGNLHVPATGTSNNNRVLKAGPTAGSASWGNVSWDEVTGKPTTFSPSSHTHGNITNDGKIGSVASRVIETGTGGILQAKPAGTASQYLRGDGTWETPPNTTYSAGNGISLSGTTFSVAAGTGLAQDASGLSLNAIAAGSGTVGALRYNGNSKSNGHMYGGTADPTNTTRLNFDGNFHATKHVANTHNVGTGTTGFDIAYNSTTKSLDFNFVG